MGDIQDDGKGGRYAGISIPKSMAECNVTEIVARRGILAASEEQFPEIVRELKEKGVVFSKDRRFAIVQKYGYDSNVDLRKREKGFLPEGIEAGKGKHITCAFSLIELFEKMQESSMKVLCPGVMPAEDEWEV